MLFKPASSIICLFVESRNEIYIVMGGPVFDKFLTYTEDRKDLPEMGQKLGASCTVGGAGRMMEACVVSVDRELRERRERAERMRLGMPKREQRNI